MWRERGKRFIFEREKRNVVEERGLAGGFWGWCNSALVEYWLEEWLLITTRQMGQSNCMTVHCEWYQQSQGMRCFYFAKPMFVKQPGLVICSRLTSCSHRPGVFPRAYLAIFIEEREVCKATIRHMDNANEIGWRVHGYAAMSNNAKLQPAPTAASAMRPHQKLDRRERLAERSSWIASHYYFAKFWTPYPRTVGRPTTRQNSLIMGRILPAKTAASVSLSIFSAQDWTIISSFCFWKHRLLYTTMVLTHKCSETCSQSSWLETRCRKFLFFSPFYDALQNWNASQRNPIWRHVFTQQMWYF